MPWSFPRHDVREQGAVWVGYLVFSRVGAGNAVGRLLESLGRESLAVYALSVSLLSFWLPIFAGRLLGMLPPVDWSAFALPYDLVVTPLVALLYARLLLSIIGA